MGYQGPLQHGLYLVLQGAVEMMAEQMKAAVAAPPPVSRTGPAAGNGKEVLLQVGETGGW